MIVGRIRALGSGFATRYSRTVVGEASWDGQNGVRKRQGKGWTANRNGHIADLFNGR